MRSLKENVLVCAVCVLVGLVFFTGTGRAEFPDSPITIVVSFAPGGPVDITTRTMAPALQSYLGQPIVVENKVGGSGAVALSYISTVKPDGYKLCTAVNYSIVQTPLMQKVAFKPLKSFTPIIGFAGAEHSALLVKSDAPWKTFKEFVEYAKKNPGKVKYSSPGIAQGVHIAMEVIALKDGIKWVHVPYPGVTPARTALLGGHVDACTSPIDWPPFVQSGQLRVLATYGNGRSPHSPDVPSIKELGYDFVVAAVYSIVGPAGIPMDIQKKLETAFTKATETPEFRATLDKLYLTRLHYGSAEYDRHLKEEWVNSEKVYKAVGLIKESATQPY